MAHGVVTMWLWSRICSCCSQCPILTVLPQMAVLTSTSFAVGEAVASYLRTKRRTPATNAPVIYMLGQAKLAET